MQLRPSRTLKFQTGTQEHGCSGKIKGTFPLLKANKSEEIYIKIGDELVRALLDTEATLSVLNTKALSMSPPWSQEKK